MRSFVGVLFVVLLEACGASRHAPPGAPTAPPARASAAPAAVAPPADAGATEAAAPAPVQLGIDAVDEPKATPAPHVEIKFPFAEQHIAVKKASRYRVRLEVQHWPTSGDTGGVELALDHYRPRRLDTLPKAVRLGDLVPADQTLEAGEHVLFAIAVRPDGTSVKPTSGASLQPFGAVHFWVGPRGKATIDMQAPMLVYSQPSGTYNGAHAADNVLLDFYLLGAKLGAGKDRVRASISGPRVEQKFVIQDSRARRISGLPSGDYRVELSLRGPDEKPVAGPWAHAARTITVNRDEPDGGKYP